MKQKNNSEPARVDTFGCSLIGKDRDINGDQYMVAEMKRAVRVHHSSKSKLDDSRRFGSNQAHVLLVADGVSGHPGAKNASSLVVDEVMESILNAVPWTQELDIDAEANLRQELKETVVRCNDQVSDAARNMPGKSDMATTLTMAFVRWPTAFVVHAGDSRAYLMRDGDIEQLTTDHTFAQQLVDEGALDPEKAETTRFAKMLWNAVGGDTSVTPELTMKTLKSGDTLLLCSDGLTSYLNSDSICHMVESKGSAQEACEELIQSIKAIGGHDDVTVAMARFEGEVFERVPKPETQPRDDATSPIESQPEPSRPAPSSPVDQEKP